MVVVVEVVIVVMVVVECAVGADGGSTISDIKEAY